MTDEFFNRMDEGVELVRERLTAHVDLWREFIAGIRDESVEYTADRLANDFVRMARVITDDWGQLYALWSTPAGPSAGTGIPTIGFIVTDDAEAADPRAVAVSFLGPDTDPNELIVTPLVNLGGGNPITTDCLALEFAPGQLRVGLQNLREPANMAVGASAGPKFPQGDYLGAVYYNQAGSPKPLASVYVVRI